MRSFVPHMMIIFTAALNVGCSKKDDAVFVDGLPYAFPRNHVADVVLPSEGMTFLRLKPPGENFLLVSDARADRRQAETGRVIISKINFSDSDRFEKFQKYGEVIFCNDMPFYNCGFQLTDQGTRWNVIFSRPDVNDFPSMRKRAGRLIASYRVRNSIH